MDEQKSGSRGSPTPKLYVGGLPYDVTEFDLLEAFQPFGARRALLNVDRNTNWSKGFGFVEFQTSEEALKARLALDGSELGGRTILVNQAIDKPRKPKTKA
jgi:RNA recognition motif-containing protein